MMRLAGRGITHPVYPAVSQRCFHSTFHLYSRINFLYWPMYQIQLFVCLFYLFEEESFYFCILLTDLLIIYIILSFYQVGFLQYLLLANYSSLLDSCTTCKPRLGLSLVAVVGSSTGWISCLNIKRRRILKTGWRYLSVVMLALKSKTTKPKFNGVVTWLVVWGEGS